MKSILPDFLILRYVKMRPRLTISALLGVIIWAMLPEHMRASTRFLLSWDGFTGVYLIFAGWMMFGSSHEDVRSRASSQEEGKILILVLITLTSSASLAAILAELATARNYTGYLKDIHIGLACITVFLSWTFLQVMYALHYAHEFYREKDGKILEGLQFPEKNHKPDYWDFIYYSVAIGTSTATSDVNITSQAMRKVTTFHSMLSFFFNATLMALTINIAASLL